MADTAKLETWLAEAEEAEHKLSTGQLVVSVDYDGHSHQYTRPNLGELRRRIRSLKKQLGHPVTSSNARVTY